MAFQMKTGFNNDVLTTGYTDEQKENLASMLSLFVSNAMINAARYCEIAKRDGITLEDTLYGIRYEVFEFMKRGDIIKSLEEVKKELFEEEEDEDFEPEFKRQDSMTYKEEDSFEDLIVDDDQIQNFTRIDVNSLTDIKKEDKDFVEKMNNYYDTWGEWEPETPMETILKDAIDKML
jgi:hypothetical protein